jgi:CDP-diacylglycerol---glycerol-3-phosphate 3-phosphatidyltransferase
MKKDLYSLPTLFTLSRLIIAPFLVPFLLVYGSPLHSTLVDILTVSVFVFFSITDFLDGYLARALGQESLIGKTLDPIADKFLLYATLIGLLVIERIYFYWVIIFIGREFFIMGLRLLAVENNLEIPVSWLGKIKTVVQFSYLALVIIKPVLSDYIAYFWMLEYGMLALALILTIGSAYLYCDSFAKQIEKRAYESDFV